MKQQQNFSIVNLAQQDVPIIREDIKTRYNWVPFGIYMQDDYYPIITQTFNTSTTHAASVEGISDLIFGKGLYTKNEAFTEALTKLIPQDELRRVVFDLKLYGNGAFQVIWNDDHTKIVKLYHTPIQTLRAEKLYDNVKIQNYFYCVDWYDMKAQKNKIRIPAYGTSKEQREILWIKNYTPGKYYYSLPDWVSALQFTMAEAELSNLHINNIENGFLPLVMINMNSGVPAPEERDTIEDLIERKFTGTRNAGRFMLSFNDDVAQKPTVDIINIENLHEKFQYVAEYAQDRILVAHRVTSPLLFGIRTENNGFSSQSEEMKTAYSILQTMTVTPFQNIITNILTDALEAGGYEKTELYFEQLTPLVILSETADETGQTVDEVQTDINDASENPESVEQVTNTPDANENLAEFHPSNPNFSKNFVTYK